MRIKFPQVLCFEEWYNLFKYPDSEGYSEKRDIYDSANRLIREAKTGESKERKIIRKDILKLLDEHKDILETIEASMLKYQRQLILEDPSVYLAYLSDSKNDGDEFKNLTAKTFWPMMSGKKKEIRIYIGKKRDYPKINDMRVIHIADDKMKEHLKGRIESGELSL